MSKSESNAPRPLTPATFHILVSLSEGATHGYRIKRLVEDRTGGAVRLGAGTLYAGLRRMVKDELIRETDAPDGDTDVEVGERWRFYEITPNGSAALRHEVARLEGDVQVARAALAGNV